MGVDDEKSAGGWLSYFWEFEGEEDELEEGDEVLEEGDTGRDRRKSASTSVAAALAIPYIGLVFRCSSSCAERGGGKERALPVSDGDWCAKSFASCSSSIASMSPWIPHSF